jgi:hypothetical protein
MLQANPEQKVTAEVEEGQQKPKPQGWISHEYSKKVPRPSISLSTKGVDGHFVTLVLLGDETPKVSWAKHTDVYVLTWTTARKRTRVVDCGTGVGPLNNAEAFAGCDGWRAGN